MNGGKDADEGGKYADKDATHGGKRMCNSRI